MLKIGHRGAAGHVLENTLGSIEQAIEIGVDYVEVDVQSTRDGRSVIVHDSTLDRTTNGKGRVNRLTLSEIKQLRTLDGQEIPTTEDVLACCRNRAGLILELKAKGLAESIAKIVTGSEFRGPLIYASFDHQDLARLRQLQPTTTIMPLIGRGAIDPDALAKLGARFVGIRFDRVTKLLVDGLKALTFQIVVYTVNDPEKIAAMKILDVDGIISDFPDRLL